MSVPAATRVTGRTLLVATSVLAAGLTTTPGPAHAAAGTSASAYRSWSSTTALQHGTTSGTRVRAGSVTIARSIGTKVYRHHRYDFARWTSPWSRPGFGASQIIASWNGRTPGRTWLKIQLRGRTPTGRTGSWDTVAYWAAGDSRIKRTSRGRQADDYARLATDTVVLRGTARYAAWQVRAVLLRPAGTTATPSLQSIGAVASVGATTSRPTSRTTMTATKDLAVPRYSQMIHRGEYPQWDGGGEAWCSPTSTTMVLRYFKSGPTKRQYAWVSHAYRHRFVDHAARYTFDARYDGTGNWPFNTAYAGSFGLDAFVTRLASLRDAEAFIKAGIPVVVSISFGRGGLSGAPISRTNGHLLVIRGFTAGGRVIVNDPAGSRTRFVRRIYDRGQFERAWRHGSGGTAYIIHPASKPLPAPSPRW